MIPAGATDAWTVCRTSEIGQADAGRAVFRAGDAVLIDLPWFENADPDG